MKPNEVRVGNWVIGVNTFPMKISIYDFETADFDALRPLPITSEVLIQLGFDNKGYFRTELSVDRFIQYVDGELFLFGSDSSTSGQSFILQCDFVHHLQNIIFDMTGQYPDLSPEMKSYL